MIPCLGGLSPVFIVLNSAFSAPRTWSVLEGIFATFSSPPAMEMSLAERTAPRTEVMLGATSPMILSVYFSAASLKPYSSSTVPQTSRSHSRSVPDISAPEDFSEDVENLVEVFDAADCLNCVEVSLRCDLCYRGLC